VIADTSPFRGPHTDDGTAFEIGAAYALGKPIFAYSADLRPLSDRIQTTCSKSGELRDLNGWTVEDFGLPHNLMIAMSVRGMHPEAEDAIAAAGAFVRSRH